MSLRDDKITDVLAILAVMKNNYHAEWGAGKEIAFDQNIGKE